MKIKQNRTDFIVDTMTIESNAQDVNQYLFCHPNLDDYFKNIEYYVEIHNHKKLIKYKYLTNKGLYTYNYFKLFQIEVNTLNAVQGINIENTELSEQIPIETQQEIESLLKKL